MIDGLKPYPDYSDVGLESLPRIPAHWATVPLKRWVTINERVLSEATAKDFLLRYIDIGTVGMGYLTQPPVTVAFGAAPSRARRLVRHGDTLVSTVRTYLKSVYHVSSAPTDLVCSTGFAVLSPRPGTDARYVGYFAMSETFTQQVTARSVGVAYPAINESLLGTLRCPVPPHEEQAAIVRFIDHADRQIRRYISAKQKLIKLLEEQRRVLIREAVTKGLDPAVALKPSRVVWLGEVPHHWDVWALGHLARIGNGSTPSRSNAAFWESGTYPWLNSASVNRSPILSADQYVTEAALRECHLPRVAPGSVLVAITGQGKTRGTAALLAFEATINQHIAYLSPRPNIVTSEYLHQSLVAAYGDLRSISEGAGSTKGALTCGDLGRFRIAVPPVEEQVRIVEYLRVATASLNRALEQARTEITLLREFLNRLIADLVTGQLDVRVAAANLPNNRDDDEPDGEVTGEDSLGDDDALGAADAEAGA